LRRALIASNASNSDAIHKSPVKTQYGNAPRVNNNVVLAIVSNMLHASASNTLDNL
jgi:hypothetical protein